MKKLLTILMFFAAIPFSMAQKQSLYAGPNQKIVAGEVAHLRGKAVGIRHYAWKTSGSGTFSNKRALYADYKPSKADVQKGKVKLTLYGLLNANISSSMTLTILPKCNEVDIALAADTICGFDSGVWYDVSATAKGSHFYAQWTTDGTGYFSAEDALSTTYEPSRMDIGSGRVWLKITVYDSLGRCPAVSDSMLLKLNDPARIDLPDETIYACGDSPIFIDGNISGTASTVTWSTNGTGYFSPTSGRDTYYYPSLQDRQQGYVSISGITNDPAGPCGAASDQTEIYLEAPLVDAGKDMVECGFSSGGEVYLAATVYNYAWDLTWTTSGSGSFDDPNSYNPTYYYDAADVNSAFVELYATVSGCTSHTDTVRLWLQAAPHLEFPEPSVYQCAPDPVYANVYLYGYASSGTWSTTGSGTFEDANSTYTAYYPSEQDALNGCVELIFTSNDPQGPCGPVSGSMSACFYDCSFDASAKRGITEADASQKPLLFPNPAREVVQLKTTGEINQAQTFVSDVIGNRISLKWADKNTLNVSSLPPGIYFLHVVSKEGKLSVLRFEKW